MFKTNRRRFLSASALGAAGCALAVPSARADKTQTSKPRQFRLGIVTYNIAKDWDLATVLDVSKRVGLSAVELRTTHKHGVEPSLTAEQRRDVKKRFTDSGVTCWGCGSVCEFHEANPATVRKNIDECKRFIKLAAD